MAGLFDLANPALANVSGDKMGYALAPAINQVATSGLEQMMGGLGVKSKTQMVQDVLSKIDMNDPNSMIMASSELMKLGMTAEAQQLMKAAQEAQLNVAKIGSEGALQYQRTAAGQKDLSWEGVERDKFAAGNATDIQKQQMKLALDKQLGEAQLKLEARRVAAQNAKDYAEIKKIDAAIAKIGDERAKIQAETAQVGVANPDKELQSYLMFKGIEPSELKGLTYEQRQGMMTEFDQWREKQGGAGNQSASLSAALTISDFVPTETYNTYPAELQNQIASIVNLSGGTRNPADKARVQKQIDDIRASYGASGNKLTFNELVDNTRNTLEPISKVREKVMQAKALEETAFAKDRTLSDRNNPAALRNLESIIANFAQTDGATAAEFDRLTGAGDLWTKIQNYSSNLVRGVPTELTRNDYRRLIAAMDTYASKSLETKRTRMLDQNMNTTAFRNDPRGAISAMGYQVKQEIGGLTEEDKKRPDGLLEYKGRTLIKYRDKFYEVE